MKKLLQEIKFVVMGLLRSRTPEVEVLQSGLMRLCKIAPIKHARKGKACRHAAGFQVVTSRDNVGSHEDLKNKSTFLRWWLGRMPLAENTGDLRVSDKEEGCDAWEDLGNRKKDKALFRIPFTRMPETKVFDESLRTLKFESNMAAILEIEPDAKVEGSGLVSISVQGKRFDFWPVSGCWFIHSTESYGTNIPKLCAQIKTKLLGGEFEGT